MNIRINNKNTRAAIELSIGTIVIIVLAMSMLILGLVLVRTIFSGATASVTELNEKVKGEVVGLFADSESDVVVKLGADKTARIKPGDNIFGVPIGAGTPDGSSIETRNRLQYKVSLDTGGSDNCVKKIGIQRTEDLFITPVEQFNSFDQYQGSAAFAIIEMKVPEGTNICSQKVFIDVKDTETGEMVGGAFYKFEVLKERIF